MWNSLYNKAGILHSRNERYLANQESWGELNGTELIRAQRKSLQERGCNDAAIRQSRHRSPHWHGEKPHHL